MKNPPAVNDFSKPNKFIFVLFACAISIWLGYVSTAMGTDLLGFTILMLVMFFVLLYTFKLQDAALTYILIASLFLRTGIALLGSYLIRLPDSEADAAMFEGLAWDIARAWTHGTEVPPTPGAYLYSKVIGFIYYAFGRIPLLANYLSVILGVFIVYFIYKIILTLGGSKKAALLGGIIAAFFPTLNLYSAVTLRENVITFFLTASVYYFLKWIKNGSWFEAGKALVLLLTASAFHGVVILVGVVYGFFLCFYNAKRKVWRLFSIQTVVMVIAALGVVNIFGKKLLNKLPSDISLIFSPSFYQERFANTAVGRGAYLMNVIPASPLDMLIQTPIRVFYFMFAPFPWMIAGLSDVVGLFDAILYLVLIFFGIKGLIRIKQKSKEAFWALILILTLAITMFAWGTANYGTAIRHRQKFVPIIISVAAMGIVRVKKGENQLVNEE